jgi:phosphoglycolate phosphatase-like HAD superfamily hydrolase
MPPRGALVDLDGVLYEGERPVPGAARVVAWLIEQGIPHLFLTNTTSRPRSAVAEKLARLGFRVGVNEILTPPATLPPGSIEGSNPSLSASPLLRVPLGRTSAPSSPGSQGFD